MLSVSQAPIGPATAATRFDALFTHFYPSLVALTVRILGDRMEAEDAVQETFLKLSNQPALLQRPDPEAGAWLRRVAMNEAFNRVRSARRASARLRQVGQLEGPDVVLYEDERSGPPEQVLREEQRAAVRHALADVPERQRECLLLRHSGYSYAEIADTLGIAVGSVGVLLARAEHAFSAIYRRQSNL
jgi:RNA polymerase sigma factor (sigma-70 family)